MANRYFLNIGANWGDTANWSDTSGGTGGFSVPTNADDVFFDANSGNCTVNASARVCKTLNFTGYTNTITMTFGITVSGNITLGAGMGIAGTSALTVDTTSTLTSNGKTWSAGFTFAGTSQTYTLADNWTISGVLRLSATTACTINSNTIYSSGNLTTTTTATTSGTTNIELTGGTWSNSSTGALRNNLTINGTITISGTVYYNTGTLTYTSGTVTVTGSTLNIAGSTTLNTSGMTWNNVTFVGISTITLLSDLNINGLFAVTTNAITINGTFSINANGGFSNGHSLSQGTGTTTLNIKGGTWTNSLAAAWLYVNTNIDGNVTISGTVSFGQRTLRYISGNVITTGSRIRLEGTCSLDTNGILWNNLGTDSGYSSTFITLLSDLNINGILSSASTTTGFGGNYNINCNGGLSLSSEITQIAGTITTLNLFGGIWTASIINGIVRINMNLRGNITISGNVYYNTNTLTYISGNVICNRGSIFNIGLYNNGTLINMDKINFRTVSIPANASITMNRFFSGSAITPTRIQSTGANYAITFQDGFEKITKFTKISNCTISRPGQLLCITDKSNKGGNVGVRYINQSPNGVAKNAASTSSPLGYGSTSYLLADPNTILN